MTGTGSIPRGLSRAGNGPLRRELVLLALKFHGQGRGLVPFGVMRARLEQAEACLLYRKAGEEFWAWFREVTARSGAGGLGGLRGEFGTYIAMKNTTRRKAANRVLQGQVQSDEAWRRAVESDRRFRDQTASRTDATAASREAYLQQWHLEGQRDAAAAQAAWDAAMAVFPWRSQ